MSDQNSLRQLVNISSAIEDALIETGGELTPEIEAALEARDLQLPEKVDGYFLVMERMDCVAQFYDSRAEVFSRLANAARNVKKKCGENIHFAMTTLNVGELVGLDTRFRLQNSPPSVEIRAEEEIPAAYKINKLVVSVDKKKILEDLKLGVPVSGAELKQGTHVRAYANNQVSKR